MKPLSLPQASAGSIGFRVLCPSARPPEEGRASASLTPRFPGKVSSFAFKFFLLSRKEKKKLSTCLVEDHFQKGVQRETVLFLDLFLGAEPAGPLLRSRHEPPRDQSKVLGARGVVGEGRHVLERGRQLLGGHLAVAVGVQVGEQRRGGLAPLGPRL